MSAPLKTYRVYCYDLHHKVVTADFLKAVDDEDAIAMARERGFGSKCEIWDGRRIVAELAEQERREA